ncbi:DM13 domain-containing protein [Pseudaestuariivita sp.]|uniref:DM13 domain-containing protein n=1 Tax=Pseudaestuariivita sp. TaxID=2211669 RepID=UPI00405A4A83
MNRRAFLGSVAAVMAAPAFAGGHGRIGTFTGASNHVTRGRAELVKEGSTYTVHLLDDFVFDGAPDPKVALGRDGYDASTLMGLLKKNRGASSYKVPAGINADDYNEVWIWCERFNVPLGVAKLS